MNNYERYKEQIDSMWQEGLTLALVGGKPTVCENTKCSECDVCWGNCVSLMAKWLVAEYKEPPIDWSKVAVDTLIIVSDDGKIWRRQYFAKYEYGKVFAWLDGATSWSSLGCATCWDYAKLWEEQK